MTDSTSQIYPSDPNFAKRANIKSMEEYQKLYRESIDQPEKFWGRMAEETVTWQKKWDSVLEWKPPFCKWFLGGKLNVSENCLDRHLKNRGDKVAILWEGEDGGVRKF